MKLTKPPCYWSSPWRNRRYCKNCSKVQYNYSGKWEDEISFREFVRRWSTDTGDGQVDLIIETATEFEFNSYETWGRYFNVKSIYKNVEVKKVSNWNEADYYMTKQFLAQTS